MVAAVSDANYVWVGGARLKSGGTDWGWQDGTPFDYINWALGEPDNTNENCLCMMGQQSGYEGQIGQIHDGSCIIATFFAKLLCQIHLPK